MERPNNRRESDCVEKDYVVADDNNHYECATTIDRQQQQQQDPSLTLEAHQSVVQGNSVNDDHLQAVHQETTGNSRAMVVQQLKAADGNGNIVGDLANGDNEFDCKSNNNDTQQCDEKQVDPDQVFTFPFAPSPTLDNADTACCTAKKEAKATDGECSSSPPQPPPLTSQSFSSDQANDSTNS